MLFPEGEVFGHDVVFGEIVVMNDRRVDGVFGAGEEGGGNLASLLRSGNSAVGGCDGQRACVVSQLTRLKEL